MTYYAGKNLSRRIKESGLEGIDELLSIIQEDGPRGWPGTQVISVHPDYLERMRTLLYSVLHSRGLKDYFTVKVNLRHSTVELDLRASAGVVQSVTTHSPLPQGEDVPTATVEENTEILDIFSTEEIK